MINPIPARDPDPRHLKLVVPPIAGHAPTMTVAHCTDLLGSLTARLRLAAGTPDGAGDAAPDHDTNAWDRTSVLDCVDELDQLQVTLAHELVRREQLERAVFDAQTALAQARTELQGTQAGERRAHHKALHDTLTALPNREFFDQRLTHALALAAPRRQPLAVMYLDLDDFKPINDTHGHAAGDEMLRIVAARLRRAVRAEDMVSRLGGDEFACLLGGLPDRAQLGRLACKVFDEVAAPYKIGAIQMRVRPSIGIAMCPGDGIDADALLKNADAAMYRAKRQQTGYAFFDAGAQGWSQHCR